MHPSIPNAHIIAPLSGLSYEEFFENYCKPRRSASRWTPQHFTERVDDRRVEIDGATYLVRGLAELIERSSPPDLEPPVVHEPIVNRFAGRSVQPTTK
ncbi:hypothetical protein BH23ACT10_BH23ACT10_17650 [soil metagenome]